MFNNATIRAQATSSGKIQLIRRTWDGVDKPDHELIYEMDLEEADRFSAELGRIKETAAEVVRKNAQNRLVAIDAKIRELTREKESLELERKRLNTPTDEDNNAL